MLVFFKGSFSSVKVYQLKAFFISLETGYSMNGMAFFVLIISTKLLAVFYLVLNCSVAFVGTPKDYYLGSLQRQISSCLARTKDRVNGNLGML